jgi:hypothetical protein
LATFDDGPSDGVPSTFCRFTKCLIYGYFNFNLLGRRFLLAP